MCSDSYFYFSVFFFCSCISLTIFAGVYLDCVTHVSHSSRGDVKVDRKTDKGTRFTNMVLL